MTRTDSRHATSLACRLFPEAVASGAWWEWRWQMQNRLTSVAAVLDCLGEEFPLPASVRQGMELAEQRLPTWVTPYYLSLAHPEDSRDPILPQVLPDPAECQETEGELDPFIEHELMIAPGVVNRYPDRALFLLTNFCATLCRHCMRKREWLERFRRLTDAEVDQAVAAIAAHPQIRDVLISGGDPLNLAPAYISRVLSRLRTRLDLDCIRLGSRVPVTLPMRVDDEMLRALEPHAPLFLNTHFNHAREITAEARQAIRRLTRSGVVVSNQAVLLRGVNDTEQDLLGLSRALLKSGMRAYYLHHTDPVQGATHFRTSLARGRDLVQSLAGKVSGLAIPNYVVDLPAGGGKVSVSGTAVLSEGSEAWTFRSPLTGTEVEVDATEGSYPGAGSWLVETTRAEGYAAAPKHFARSSNR